LAGSNHLDNPDPNPGGSHHPIKEYEQRVEKLRRHQVERDAAKLARQLKRTQDSHAAEK
jgi:hypothetical protein